MLPGWLKARHLTVPRESRIVAISKPGKWRLKRWVCVTRKQLYKAEFVLLILDQWFYSPLRRLSSWLLISCSPICTHDDETDCSILNLSSDLHCRRFGKSRIRSSGREPWSERVNLAVPRYSYDSWRFGLFSGHSQFQRNTQRWLCPSNSRPHDLQGSTKQHNWTGWVNNNELISRSNLYHHQEDLWNVIN